MKKINTIETKAFRVKGGDLIPVISFNDACEVLQVGRRSMHNYVHSKGAPQVLKDKHGKCYFDLAEFEAWRANRARGKYGTNRTPQV